MTESAKRKTIVLLGAVIPLTMLIAANLPQLELQPGMPLPRMEKGQLITVPIQEAPFVSVSVTQFILVVMALVLTGATLYTVYQLLRGVDWKLILYVLRYMLIIPVVIGCLVFMVVLFPGSNVDTPAEMPIPSLTPQPVITSPLGTAPPSLLWLVGIALLVITVLVAVGMFTPSRQARSIDRLRLEAESARQALITGADLKDVIVNCYHQMSLAMKQEQGIERENFMTTGEFETILQSVGIPHEPIHQLTRLFEVVRYGHWQPDAADEQQALRCLEAIMSHSRNARQKK